MRIYHREAGTRTIRSTYTVHDVKNTLPEGYYYCWRELLPNATHYSWPVRFSSWHLVRPTTLSGAKRAVDRKNETYTELQLAITSVKSREYWVVAIKRPSRTGWLWRSLQPVAAEALAAERKTEKLAYDLRDRHVARVATGDTTYTLTPVDLAWAEEEAGEPVDARELERQVQRLLFEALDGGVR